jgi:ectoine hydroxylase-related dioxygenase (phytanoyl-CoA dioxygenase family)
MTNISISDDQRDFLDTNGYVLLENALPLANLNKAKKEIEHIFSLLKESSLAKEQQNFWLDDNNLSLNQSRILRIPNVDKLLTDDAITTIISALSLLAQGLGFTDAHPVAVHAFYKPAVIGSETPWHQDPAYGDNTIIYDNITFWIPLSEVPFNSSCLEFIPGSHRDKKLVPHYHLRKERLSALVAQLNSDMLSNSQRIPCAYRDVIAHKSYVIHRATTNLSPLDRYSIVFVYSKNNHYL